MDGWMDGNGGEDTWDIPSGNIFEGYFAGSNFPQNNSETVDIWLCIK